jgi:signal transduction histidine kinase
MTDHDTWPTQPRTCEEPLFSPNTAVADLESVIAGLPHAVLIGDQDGLIRANRTALRLFDLEAAPLGRAVPDLIAGSRLAHSLAGREMTAADHPFALALLGRISVCDATLDDRATDRRLCLRCHGVPLRRDGALVGAMVVYCDVSDLRRTTEVLSRTNQELREFSAILAHDLHEPLRMITSFLDLARQRECVQKDQKAMRHLDFSANSAQRMRVLIDDLLKLTHCGRALRRSRTDVTVVVREALDNLALAMGECRAEVVCASLPEVYADRAQLLLVFQNLLSNAAKYADDVRPLRITISGETREKDTLFTVVDNGIGIAPEACQRIFAPFDRLHAKDGAAGTGLGLTICKRVVSRHRGDIWAEAGPEHGTIFRFTIPHTAEDGALEPNPPALGT